jgi:hypothetical protein
VTVPPTDPTPAAEGLSGRLPALQAQLADPSPALVPLLQRLGLPVQTPGDAVNAAVLLGLAVAALAVLALQLAPADPVAAATRRLQSQAAQHGRGQGRRSAAELAEAMPLPAAGGLPLGYAPPAPWRPWRPRLFRRPMRAVGLPWDASRGHLLVAGPTTSGKSFHATDALLRFPGPAIVVDPKEELWRRTAGTRAAEYGPVYRIPNAGVDLAACFDLDQDLDRRELFECLLRPWQDGPQARIFTDRTYPLIEAAVLAGRATGQHPLRLLARWAKTAPGAALAEAQPHAPAQVAVVTDGTPLGKLTDNRFFLSSWGTFTTKLGPLAGQIHTLAMRPEDGGVPERWADAGATIYLTYPLHAQGAVGPLAAALVAGLLRHLQAAPPPSRTLLALDEAPAVGLPNLATYLATIGGAGAGVTCCVYVQNLSQLEAVYGRQGMEAIVSNAHFQVFFPPRDTKTGRYLSDLFGEELEPVLSAAGGTNTGAGQSAGRAGAGGLGSTRSFSTSQSASWNVTSRYRRFWTDAQAMALTPGQVAVFAAGHRALLTDCRTVLGPRAAQLPPPPAPASPAASAAGAAPPSTPPPPPVAPSDQTIPDAPPPPAPPKGGTRTPPASAQGLW